jgi:plastocyanin
MTNMKIAAILVLPSLIVASFYALSVLPLTANAAAESAADATISIDKFMFEPTSITVTVGTTVHWKNLDPEPHTVRGVETNFRSDALDQNDSFAHKFDKPGTYRYVCSIHPQMLGTIVVKAAGPPN